MILVFGATGRISTEVIALLRAHAHPHRIMAPGIPNPAMFGLDSEVVTAVPISPEAWAEAFAGVSALFLSNPGNPAQLELQRKAVEEAKRAGVRRIVKISNLGASLDSQMVQARWNWQLEQDIAASGIPYTILRPRFLLQNFLIVFAPGIKSDGTFFAPAGDTRIPYVDLRDVAEASLAVLTEAGHENRTYEITGPEALSCQDLAHRFSQALERPVRFEDVTPEEGTRLFARLGLPGQVAMDVVAMFAAARAAERPDASSVVTPITHKPARSFDQFVAENLAAF